MRKLILILLGLQMLISATIAGSNLHARISKKNGIPVLLINDKQQVPHLIYHTLLTRFRTFPNVLGKDINPSVELVKLAEKHGFHLTTMPMPLIWPKDGKPADYSKLDKIMNKHIELDPQVMAIPRLIGRPPVWWVKKHQQERQQYRVAPGHGEMSAGRKKNAERYVTPSSKKWRKAYYDALRKQVRYLESKYGNYIIGYHPGIQSCGENFFPFCWAKKPAVMVGFSEPFRLGFIEYAKKKYKTITATNKAWHTKLKSFNDIKVPTMKERIAGDFGTFRDPNKQRFVIDFMTYFQQPIVKVTIDTARIIKEETDNKKLTLFFFSAPQNGHYPLGPGQGGSLGLKKLLECPDIDIICNPYGYRNRQYGGTGILSNLQDSITANNKMYFVEDDTRTHKAPFNHFGKTKNMRETKEIYKRLFAQTLQYGVGNWKFDFGSGYMAIPELFKLFESMRKIREKFELVPFKPEVALVFDDESPLYLRCSNEVFIHTFNMAGDYPLIGVPFGRYLLSDVCAGKVPKETKVLFFFNAYKIDDKQRKQLHKVLAEGGKTAVWFYAPGYIDGKKAAVENIYKTTGIAVEAINKLVAARYQLSKNYSNLKKGYIFGVYNKLGTLFKIKRHQKGVSCLANYEKSQNPALAVKRMGNWTSILFCGVRFGPAMFRAIAKENGVHIYSYTNDSINGSSNFIALTAIGNLKKTLYFKKNVDLTDIFTGEKVASGVKKYTFDLKKGKTRIFMKK